MTQPPDWAINTPSSQGVHTRPPRAYQWEGLSQDQMRALRQQLLESILAWVTQSLTGLYVPGGFGTAVDQLENWATDLMDVDNLEELTGLDFSSPPAFIGSLIVAIGEVIGIDLHELGAIFSSVDMSSPEAFVTSLGEALGDLGKFLTKLSPLNALNLFNLVPTDLLGHVSASAIGTVVTNLVTDPDFLDPAPIEGWVHDPTGGYGGTGSRTATADGSSKELLGNLIPVSEGQVLPLSARAKWEGLAGTGNPIALGVTGYQSDGASAQSIVASHNTIPPTTDWLTLAGNYTVPANVVSLRTRLIVGATATAGAVSFSTVKATKVGPMLQKLIAGTDVGDFLPDDITNLFNGIIINALELLNKAGLGDFNDLMSTIGGDIGDDIDAVEQRLNDFLHGLSPLNANNVAEGSIADRFVTGITTINDNIVTRLLNIAGSGFGHGDAAAALMSNTVALVDTSARLSRLENTFTGGVSDGDDFERTSSTSLGPGWLTYYSSGAGTWATPNGHDASWSASGIGDREFICIRNTGTIRSATNLQRVGMVLSSKAPEWFGFCGHNDIWLRVSDATTSLANVTGIRIRFGGDGSVSVDRFINGARVRLLPELAAGSITPPGPGAQIIGLAGEPGTARVFRAVIGTSLILECIEIGVASGLGPTFLRWGHGGRAEGHLLPTPGQDGPGSAHQWTGMDQVTI
jgi:hypothetical protein